MTIKDDELAQQLLALARGTEYGLSAFLEELQEEFIVGNTLTKLRTFYVTLDGRGVPRISDLHRALARHTLDYAIPRSKILEARKECDETNSTAKLVGLADESRALFTNLSKTGEGGELLLFALCEQILGLPLVIAKMNLKTDNEMHFHGADGVYVGLTNENKLALYWGESKIYSDRSQAAKDCFESVSRLLLPSGGINEDEDRDLELLRDYSDLGDADLTGAFQEWLVKENPSFNEIDFRAVCLVGFDQDCYPKKPKTMGSEQVRAEINKHIKAYESTVAHYVKKFNLSSFELIAVCLPVPSAQDFRDQFLKLVLNKP